jgi:hypothetical protein
MTPATMAVMIAGSKPVRNFASRSSPNQKAAVLVNTNLLFSECTRVVANPRLLEGVARPHYRSCVTIGSATESYRLQIALEKRKGH